MGVQGVHMPGTWHLQEVTGCSMTQPRAAEEEATWREGGRDRLGVTK